MAVPKIIPYDVELRSVNPVRSFDRPKAYTNDLKSVEFQFKILDMTSIELNTATAITLVYMRDGSFFANPSTDVERVGNVFSYLLKENEGNHAGVAQIQLVVTIDDAEFASQLFDFEIINGLETKVAQEVMIYDWTTLTRDARAYIDQFVADEVFRDAQFDNAQFDRNVAFVSSQESRDLAFGVEQTNRGTAFTAEQTNRNTAFTNDQDARALTFSESESGRTTAETGRVTAESNRVTAESGRVTKESQRVTAETNRVTAEGNRVTAESGRVTAENARVTAETNRAAAFTAFNTRLTAEETATAANKISAVKSKTFADVDARFEDVEADTTMMGTNGALNGDFSNGTYGYSGVNATVNAANNTLQITAEGSNNVPQMNSSFIGLSQSKHLMYFRVNVRVTNASASYFNAQVRLIPGYSVASSATTMSPVNGQWYTMSFVAEMDGLSYTSWFLRINTGYSDAALALGKVTEVQYFSAINLTAAFGKGNEPTSEQMDGIMAKFTNSWFNGTANLFRANATLNKLMAIDARTEFDAKNGITNGDFSNGTTGWFANTSVISVLNNELTMLASATNGSIAQSITGGTVVGNKYYAKAFVKSTSPSVRIVVGTTFTSHIGNGAYMTLSTIHTATSTSHSVSIVDGRTSAWDSVFVKYILTIDLTATFGAGKEPTLAEMDRLMARFPNSWFDGVKPIQTIETLYQEKANKAQEAWITPTLINSWVGNYNTQYSEPKYFKDEFGFVHIKGMAASGSTVNPAFILPIGYRPQHYAGFICGSSASAVAKVVITPTGDILVPVYSTFVHLDGIRFKVN